MSKAIEARKRQVMAPVLAGVAVLGAGVYYLSRQPKENIPNVEIRGANGVIGAGGASTGNVSSKLQSTFGTGGSTAGVGAVEETKDTRVASNMTGLYTKREADKPEDRDHRNPRVPRGENAMEKKITGETGSPGK
ncbi:hypothetical protein FHETE_11214 [Fusarium heterosporum]|uniref:Uncharacterized protein n=1 Tax=Fusarium heterosporum TaxID=42747 RepID=A0A8H5WAF9_FUSHE|nr:hypothetical protein FHETE_11214 [Fusarium heterosporum]